MSHQQLKTMLSTRQTKAFAEYFPGEAITNRLINLLYLVLTWKNGRLKVNVQLDIYARPQSIIYELKSNRITPDDVREVRLAKIYDRHHFDWFEGSDIFYYTFVSSINEQGLEFVSPTLLKCRRIDECIMLFDGIIGDRETMDVFLLNAKKRWSDFKPVIETFKWVGKGVIQNNIRAIESSLKSSRGFIPCVQENFSIDDPYIKFMVWVFSLGIQKDEAKMVSTEAKKIIRQSLPRKTKGKSQVNILIENSTIDKLEKSCSQTKLSKAKLISHLIEIYFSYRKEIDATIKKEKSDALHREYLAQLDTLKDVFQPIPSNHDETENRNNIDTGSSKDKLPTISIGGNATNELPKAVAPPSRKAEVESKNPYLQRFPTMPTKKNMGYK